MTQPIKANYGAKSSQQAQTRLQTNEGCILWRVELFLSLLTLQILVETHVHLLGRNSPLPITSSFRTFFLLYAGFVINSYLTSMRTVSCRMCKVDIMGLSPLHQYWIIDHRTNRCSSWAVLPEEAVVSLVRSNGLNANCPGILHTLKCHVLLFFA